jgi:hypothetical protein
MRRFVLAAICLLFAVLITVAAAEWKAPAGSPPQVDRDTGPGQHQPFAIERCSGTDALAIPTRNLVLRLAGSRWELVGGQLISASSLSSDRGDTGSRLAGRDGACGFAGQSGLASLQALSVRLQI